VSRQQYYFVMSHIIKEGFHGGVCIFGFLRALPFYLHYCCANQAELTT